MATLIKEKQREKKKKVKDVPSVTDDNDLGPPPTVSDLTTLLENEDLSDTQISSKTCSSSINEESCSIIKDLTKESQDVVIEDRLTSRKEIDLSSGSMTTEADETIECLSENLTEMEIQICQDRVNTQRENLFSNKMECTKGEENTVPSAPVLVEQRVHAEMVSQEVVINEHVTKLDQEYAMSLGEAERLFCGNEIAHVKALGEREAMLVENSALVTPEHPLVDLLSTLRRSLIAVERERNSLACGHAEEEKLRRCLWKVEKREVVARDQCPCGAGVEVRARYDHATLLKEKLPAARMRLESLARDAQESYCHHVHSALLAYQQIEEFLYETMHTTISQVRMALSLVMEALRTSDSAPAVHAEALQRWATALVVKLVSYGHLADLLFVWHLMFRQNRSVRWAARIMRVTARDLLESARIVALLDLLLCGSGSTQLDAAAECTEGSVEVWEEVCGGGAGGAVAAGALRERDLLAWLRALPLRELVARMALVRPQNITEVREYEWGDGGGGRGVLKAACGARVLLAALRRGRAALPHYPRVAAELARLAAHCMRALADLHAHSRLSYAPELRHKMSAELEAVFFSGCSLLLSVSLCIEHLPFSMLTAQTTRVYYSAIMSSLHATEAIQEASIEGIQDGEIPGNLGCKQKLQVIAQMAIDRTEDHDLAKTILNSMLQVAFSRRQLPCGGQCRDAARSLMPQILLVHPYLYAETICAFGLLGLGVDIQESDIGFLSPVNWVPAPQEMVAVLKSLSHNNPTLLPHLLLSLDTTPHVGLPHETQLAVGGFLCEWVCACPRDAPEWAWLVLRKLHLHRAEWGESLDAPSPENAPEHLFHNMYALLATSWGHCVPLICEYGVEALRALAAAGRARDALHCLRHVARVMAQSPESIAYTPRFAAVCEGVLGAGPTLVQRALGRGGSMGHSLLLELIIHQLSTERRPGDNVLALLSAWVQLCRAHPSLVEAALVACHDCPDLDNHVAMMLEDDDLRRSWITAAGVGLQTYACRSVHLVQELRGGLWPRLLDALYRQRCGGASAHVDNALQSVGADFRSEALVIHRVATTLLTAPHAHPAHLALWNTFFYLYLQRPPSNMQEASPPMGPLFFNGFVKSRTLSQLKKKLQDTATYHRNMVDKVKIEPAKPTKSADSSQTRKQTEPVKEKSLTPESVNNNVDLLPSMTLHDLTGESSGSSSEESSSDDDSHCDDDNRVFDDERAQPAKVVVEHAHVKNYHEGAERACRDYLRWLESGDAVRALPHRADLNLYISPQAMNAAYKLYLKNMTPPTSVSDTAETKRTVPPPPTTPLERLTARLHKYNNRTRRARNMVKLKPSLDVAPSDTRSILRLIDDLLVDLVKLAQEWEAECARVSVLDAALWKAVCVLRERRALSPVRRSCMRKCAPITLVLQAEEWCVSAVAARAVADNRAQARAVLRRLTRPKPRTVRLVARLHSAARLVCEADTAAAALGRAWRCADVVLQRCPAARDALVAFVTHLAHRHIVSTVELSAALTEQWSARADSTLRQELSGALLCPHRVSPRHVPCLYRAVLRSRAPPHLAFRHLSKFEISKWIENADVNLIREMVEMITETIQTFGPQPPEDHHILIELLCVHVSAMLGPCEWRAHVLRCARASAAASLPCTVLAHLSAATATHACHLPPDQLCSMFRELGVIWWEARTKLKQGSEGLQAMYAMYAPHFASLLRLGTHALVHALRDNAPEHVSWQVWSVMAESWSPWLVDSPAAAPLLPPTQQARDGLLSGFVDVILDVYNMVPDGSCRLLQEVYLWSSAATQTPALLSSLHRLPWSRTQWFHTRCMPTALQLTALGGDARALSRQALRGTRGAGWLAGAEGNEAPQLAALLHLLTHADMHADTLEESLCLPWHRLPLLALEPQLEQFFTEHQTDSVEYHKLPYFKVVLYASEMAGERGGAAAAHEKRLALVSHWARAVAAPRAAALCARATAAILDAITQLYKTSSENDETIQNEIEEILTRAITILCTEPSATEALPVWREWCAGAPPALAVATVRALPAVTAAHRFAALADVALVAYLAAIGADMGEGLVAKAWCRVQTWWEGRVVAGPATLAARGAPLAAYVLSAPPPQPDARACTALVAADKLLWSSEVAAALWVCLATRACRGPGGGAGGAGEGGAALVALCAQEPRRSLLRTLSLTRTDTTPPPRLRLLARLAQCLLTPGEVAAKAYESCHSSLVHNTPTIADTAQWGKTPRPRMVPKLAVKLYPNFEHYFALELEMTPDEN